MLRVKHAGSIKDARPYARHAGAIKPVKEVWVKFNNALSRVWTAFTASMSSSPPGFTSHAPSRSGPVFLTVEVAVEGTAPYGYAWSINSVPNLTVSGSDNFRTLELGGTTDISISTTVTCVVTDAAGNTVTLTETCTLSRGILA